MANSLSLHGGVFSVAFRVFLPPEDLNAVVIDLTDLVSLIDAAFSLL